MHACRKLTILFIGGSTTYTIRIRDNKKIFSHGLELRLNEQFREELGDRHIQVINAGLGGATSAESLIRLAFFGSEIMPDLVVIQHGLNDVRARMTGEIRPDYANYRKSWEVPSSFNPRYSIAYGITLGLARFTLLGNFIAHKAHLTKARQLGAYTNHPQEGDAEENCRRNGPEYFARNTRYMVALAREMGAHVLLVTVPFTSQLDAVQANATREHARILKEITAEKKALFFDLASEMNVDEAHLPDGMHASQIGSDLKRDLYFNYFVKSGVVAKIIAQQGHPED